MSAFLVTNPEITFTPMLHEVVPFTEVERLLAIGELTVSDDLIELKKFNAIFKEAKYDSVFLETDFYYVETDFKNKMTVFKAL